MPRPISTFSTDQKGGVALLAALLLPVVLVLCGGVIDYGHAFAQRQRLQNITDKAALSAARELGLSDAVRESLSEVVKASVSATLTANRKGIPTPTVETSLGSDPLEVTVRAESRVAPLFGGGFGLVPVDLKVVSVARIVGRPNVCLLALERSEPAALWLVKSSRMTGNNCSVFSNSSSTTGLIVRDDAVLSAKTVCSAGGIDKSGKINPEPIGDCPTFEDPLAGRPEPLLGDCDYKNVTVSDATETLSPGVYCGGLSITGTAKVTLEPGVYAIKDGLLSVRDQASIDGTDVSFFLGPSTWFLFGPESSVSLSARKTGELAGLLFFASRAQSKIITHSILSKNAQRLVGTVYLPNNSFVVDGDASVGGASAYTAIVARRVVLLNGPELILNSNYDQTDVPVPASLRGTDQPVALVK